MCRSRSCLSIFKHNPSLSSWILYVSVTCFALLCWFSKAPLRLEKKSAALDYGGIGSIIGHELTHAFDIKGRHFNEIGNLEDWWQPDTLNSYMKKTGCFENAYGNYSTNFNGIEQNVDSKVTPGEDISDNGAFKESLLAYRKFISKFGENPMLPQFEHITHEQLFTIAFANVWCENPTKLSSLINRFDNHSPHPVRVNGVFRNSEEITEIWKCPKGSRMNPIGDKCSLW